MKEQGNDCSLEENEESGVCCFKVSDIHVFRLMEMSSEVGTVYNV